VYAIAGGSESLQRSVVQDRVAVPLTEVQEHRGCRPLNTGQGHRDPDSQPLILRAERIRVVSPMSKLRFAVTRDPEGAVFQLQTSMNSERV
jgi:hypothetical protein